MWLSLLSERDFEFKSSCFRGDNRTLGFPLAGCRSGSQRTHSRVRQRINIASFRLHTEPPDRQHRHYFQCRPHGSVSSVLSITPFLPFKFLCIYCYWLISIHNNLAADCSVSISVDTLYLFTFCRFSIFSTQNHPS